MDYLDQLAKRARAAAVKLGTLATETKDAALTAMAVELERGIDEVLAANARDMEAAREEGVTGALLDRLNLDEARVKQMADGLRDVAALRDPVGEVVDGWRLPNGLQVEKVRVPLGVVGIIY
jgi:glutamate-5-semialdehyde dehydrogenase